jgi:hypothetical protein
MSTMIKADLLMSGPKLAILIDAFPSIEIAVFHAKLASRWSRAG